MEYANPIFLFLVVVSGVCWTVVYLDSIRIGFKQKTYAMPIIALAFNLCWEGVYAYTYLADSIVDIQGWINFVWCMFDIVILYTFIKFGKEEFCEFTAKKNYVLWVVLIFVMALSLQISFKIEFLEAGPLYSAFVQNLLMSVLYINMLKLRKSSRGQTRLIAYAKCIGTLCATGYGGIIADYQLATVLGIFCLIFDIVYIVMLNKQIKTEKC